MGTRQRKCSESIDCPLSSVSPDVPQSAENGGDTMDFDSAFCMSSASLRENLNSSFRLSVGCFLQLFSGVLSEIEFENQGEL